MLAWVVSRLSKRLAERMVGRYEAKNVDPDGASTEVIVSLKRHETIVSLVQTTVRYVAYVLATLFAIAQLVGRAWQRGDRRRVAARAARWASPHSAS